MRLKLREIRKAQKIRQPVIAERLNTTTATISRWETGEAAPPMDRLAEIAAAYNSTVPEIFDLPPVPVMGLVGAGAEVLPIDDYPLGQANETIARPPGVSGVLVAVRVVGDSMLPRYDPGDLLLYTRENETMAADVIGRYCVVNLNDGRMMVKKVQPGKKLGTYTLTSPNAPPVENVFLRWAAPVRAVVSGAAAEAGQ